VIACEEYQTDVSSERFVAEERGQLWPAFLLRHANGTYRGDCQNDAIDPKPPFPSALAKL
jgi:hypothetical protein